MILDCGCPDAYPDWHQQDVDFGHHPVHTLPIASFLHMPLAYDTYRQRQQLEVEQLGLEESWPGFALTHTGLLRGSLIRLLKDAHSPSRHVGNLAGGFRVNAVLHEGGIGTIRSGLRQQQMALLDSGRRPKELYLAYLTCPRCMENRGGERILLVRRWEENTRLGRRLKKQANAGTGI